MTLTYPIGYSCSTLDALSRRSAATSAAFLIPRLRPGMTVVDCGCGPGTITVDLAEKVAPGRVIGIDLESAQFETGRARARARGLDNVTFVRADIRALPLAPETVDAVFMNAVLIYLGEEHGSVLRSLKRALRPGGVIGVSDPDYGGNLWVPSDPALDRAFDLIHRLLEDHGATPFGAREHRRHLREAGFVRIVGSASSETYGESDGTREAGYYWAWFLGRLHAERVIERGWADQRGLRDLAAALIAWGQHPDAFLLRCRCEALGFKAMR
jgi:ubiquinone/menaquinone biosynthesis C-methylase UbiE